MSLPSKDPETLGQWYVDRLGFQRDGRFLWSADTLLVFEAGAPIDRGTIHFGFRVETRAALERWYQHMKQTGAKVGDLHADGEAVSSLLLTGY